MPNHALTAVQENGDRFEDLFLRAKSGCPIAIQRLFDKYARCFLRVIRYRMSRKLRLLFDSEDFLQEVRIKLFLNDLAQQHFQNPSAFIAYIKRIAENQVQQATRKYLLRPTSNLNREKSFSALTHDEIERLVDSAPAVCTVCAAEEEWKLVLESLSPEQQEVAHLLRAGSTHSEIAVQLGTCERTVGRVLKKIDEKLSMFLRTDG